jgi:hypothetical protein
MTIPPIIGRGIDFYVGRARAAKGPALDIARGTGRVLLPVLQAGMDGPVDYPGPWIANWPA